MTVSCPPPERLRAFMLGKLPDVAATTIAGHLDECTACDKSATSLEALSDTFIAELRRPTGDATYLQEGDFHRAAAFVAEVGQAPSDVEIDGPAAQVGQPQRLGQYQLLEKLGEGGMGTVYKALHARLDKIVAVKVLPPQRTHHAAAVARFDREMKAVGRLDHTNIVRAMDAGEVEGVNYLVMEYVQGIDLSRLARTQGPLPIADACELIRQAAIGLEHAHEHGLVHRDIKPSNLILTNGARPNASSVDNEESSSGSTAPTVKVLDLGLALLAETREGDAGQELTSTGQLMGTLDYMAPEQGGDSHEVDIRADIYALGATLYRLLVGAPIYDGPQHRTQLQKVAALVGQPAPPIQSRRADIPAPLADVVHRMIAKDPQERYQTPAQVAQALAPFAREANLARLLDACSGVGSEVHVPAPERPTSSSSAWSEDAPQSALVSPKSTARRRWVLPAVVLATAAALIGVLLAAIFIFRTPEGTVTVMVDDAYRKDVSVVLASGGKRLEISDASGWQMELADGQYEVALAGSKDKFEIDHDTVTVRRGEDVVVRVERKPPPVVVDRPDPTPPDSDPPVEVAPSLGEKAIEWLAANNDFDPQAPDAQRFIRDARDQILPITRQGRSFSYRISGDLLKSGRPTVLVGHGRTLITHTITPAQAQLMEIGDHPIVSFVGGPREPGKRAQRPEFNLTKLSLDEEPELGSDGSLTGWVDFERLRRTETADPKYHVRVVFMRDGAMTVVHGISGDLGVDAGSVRLNLSPKESLPPINSPAAMTMLVELGRFIGPTDDFNNFEALSEPVSQVVTLYPAEADESSR